MKHRCKECKIAPLRLSRVAARKERYTKVLIVWEDHNQSKYKRFELDTEDSYKRWDLLPRLATDLNKNIVNHISEKDLTEKVLQEKQVPSNIKNVQILDEYIKEILIENRKSYTLNDEKVLKEAQEQVMAIFAPLTTLYHIM